METPEYIQIIRRHLAASRAAAHAEADAAPAPGRSDDEGSANIVNIAIMPPAQAGSGSLPLEDRARIAQESPRACC